MSYPENLKYTEDHEWIRVEGNDAYVGITSYAQDQLGDVVFVEIETEDEDLDKGDVFGTIEAVKTVSDLLMPVTGKIVEVNALVQDDPELVNKAPYGDGWMIKIAMTDPSELDDLKDAAAYTELVG